MFSLSKLQPDYEAEFRRYKHEFGSQFTPGDSRQEQVFFAVSYINTELGKDGAGNWRGAYDKIFLDRLRQHLTSEKSFTEAQRAKIRGALDEIQAYGQDVEQRGESSRSVTEAIDYLVMRVIDWLRLHPKGE